MDVVLGIIAVIDLLVSCIAFGYDLLKDWKNKHAHKNDRPSPIN